ncbi:substrate-binding domain-containing protein [Glaciihabitans sp. UYNi722]|uniref:substrate-binding domain-containing protein n=1 Tax=Glaciihabitans sp. UYNi722 TaxID=3156344 RepID=UPI003392BA54
MSSSEPRASKRAGVAEGSAEEATPKAPRPATLELVAREAAVSLATASKVLNDRPGVAPETRERVASVFRRHGYTRRGMAETFAPTIELVFGALDGAWPIELIRGAVQVASENGFGVSVTESGHGHAAAPEWIGPVLKRQPAGVILIASDLAVDAKYQLRSRSIPFVIVDPAGDPADDVPSVGSTNWAGGVQATRHLIELGHRNIGVIAGSETLLATRARIDGFRSAMNEAGLPINKDFVVVLDFDDEASPEPGLQLLTRPDRPTAIFATSDVKALATYEAARTLGLSIPHDLSIVGYDDLQFARLAGPPLTTIRQPLKEMAQAAAQMIIERRQHQRAQGARVELSTSLILRSSTTAPAQVV